MMAMEPSGPSQAISKIFWFDITTGKARLNEFDEADALIGPGRSADFVKSKTQGYTWFEQGKDTSGTYLIIEPRPVQKRGQKTLYWMYSITTREYSGIALTVLISSQNSDDVLHFCSKENLVRWLNQEGNSDDPKSCSGGSSQKVNLPATNSTPALDLGKLSDDQLIKLLQDIANELQHRRSK